MISFSALAAALPGIALPGIRARVDMFGRLPLHTTRGGKKGREPGRGEREGREGIEGIGRGEGEEWRVEG